MTTSPLTLLRYCRSCGYNLHALTTPRCPECGRDFDPNNPTTFSSHPPLLFHQVLWRWTKRLTIFLLTLLIIFGTPWTYLYYGWHQEQSVLLKVDGYTMQSLPIGGFNLRNYLRPVGFVLDRVESLSMSYSPITEAKLAQLHEFKELDNLYLYNTTIDEAGLVHLQKIQGLYQLRIDNISITDAGLVHLKDIKNLRYLEINHAPITDAGLVHIKEISGLYWLNINNTLITDAGLVQLKELKELRSLALYDTPITDAGLVHLKDIKKLQRLILVDHRT